MLADLLLPKQIKDALNQVFEFDKHQLLIDRVKRWGYWDLYLGDYANIACPNDPNYLSPLHIAILKGSQSFVRRLLEKRANIIYHATPDLRHDLLHVAINSGNEKIAQEVFSYGTSHTVNDETEENLVEKIASIITDDGTTLSDLIQYLEPAIDNHMPALTSDIVNTIKAKKVAIDHEDALRLLPCITKAIQQGYSSIASEMITTLPYEMANEYLYCNIDSIPEKLVSDFLKYHGDEVITKQTNLFNLLIHANHLNTAFSLASRLPDLDAQLVALIKVNAPVSELLLDKAISHGLRNATKLLLDKNCPGSEKALKMCIDSCQENMACELISNGHNVNTVFDNQPLWVKALNKGLNNAVRWMIQHGLDLNSHPSAATPIVKQGENILLASLRKEEWDFVLEIIKRKPPIEYINDALNKAHIADNTSTLDKISNLIISLSSDEAMTPYVEALLNYVSDLQPSHTLYMGNALHEANLPHLAYPLLTRLSLKTASVEDYQKAQSICGHIELTNCPENETDEEKEHRIDACVEHLLKAEDTKLTKLLYKDLYTKRQHSRPATAEVERRTDKPMRAYK